MRVPCASEVLSLGGVCSTRLSLSKEAVGAVVGDVEPSDSGDFQAFFTAPLTAVPEAFEAIGVGAAFGDEAGVDNEGLLMVGRDDLGNRRLVEGDKVEASIVPSRKGTLVIGTVTAEITKGGMAGKHQHKSQQMGDELSLRFLGLGQGRKYTVKQSHGTPPFSVALANTTLELESSCGYLFVKTVRSIVCTKSS